MTVRDRIQFRLGRLWSDERVADFLIELSTEPDGSIRASSTIAMSRADMADHLGVTIETVSRALSRLARDGLICFADKSRRELQIPNLDALGDYVQRLASPAPTLQ